MDIGNFDLLPGETPIFVVRQHAKCLVKNWLLLIVIVAAAGSGIWLVMRNQWNGWVTLVILAIALILLIPAFVVPLVNWSHTAFLLTDQRLCSTSGVIRRDVRTVPLSQTQEVNLDQSGWDRLWSAGTVSVSTAGDNDDVILAHIPHAKKRQEVIERAIYNFEQHQVGKAQAQTPAAVH